MTHATRAKEHQTKSVCPLQLQLLHLTALIPFPPYLKPPHFANYFLLQL